MVPPSVRGPWRTRGLASKARSPASGEARHPAAGAARHPLQWANLFGAGCPARGVAAGLVLPFADTAAMNAHLAEIAATVAPGAPGAPGASP